MLPMVAVGWQASVLRGKEAGHFREVAGVSVVVSSPHAKIDTSTVDSRVA